MKYDEIILKDLISIYEKRDSNSSNFRTKIKLKLTIDKYPKYFEDRFGYDEAIEDLVRKEYIFKKLVPHDTVIDYIYLNLEKIDEIKDILEIDSVSEKRQKLLNALELYDDEVIVSFKNKILGKIKNNKSIKEYLNPDYIDVLKAVHYLENLDHDVYERNASNYIFNDSKRLKKLEALLNSFYDCDDIFAEKGIMSVTPYLYVKGQGIININHQIIDLSLIENSIGVPIDNINALSFSCINKVTTVENLTTFHDYESDGLIIYLGGFSTRNQILVLNKIKDVCDNFYHFGDIDYGGFTILNNLMENLNLNITGINMDLETLKKNIKFAQSFEDEKYIKKLNSLLNKPLLANYYDVIKYLIDNKIWLEQESFYNI